jgi:hypothetical protein
MYLSVVYNDCILVYGVVMDCVMITNLQLHVFTYQ